MPQAWTWMRTQRMQYRRTFAHVAMGGVIGLLASAWVWATPPVQKNHAPAAARTGAVHGQVQTTLGRQVVLRADAPSVALAQSPRALYVLHCAGCHGLDGSGSASARVPDMRQVGRFLRVPGGREFLVQVPGVMGSGLDDAQVAQVSNWMLSGLAADSVPSPLRPYTAEEIARLRRQVLVDVGAVRADLARQAQQLGWPLAPAL